MRRSYEVLEGTMRITHLIVGRTSWRWSLRDAGIDKIRMAPFPFPSCTKVEDKVVPNLIQSPNGNKSIALGRRTDNRSLTAVTLSARESQRRQPGVGAIYMNGEPSISIWALLPIGQPLAVLWVAPRADAHELGLETLFWTSAMPERKVAYPGASPLLVKPAGTPSRRS